MQTRSHACSSFQDCVCHEPNFYIKTLVRVHLLVLPRQSGVHLDRRNPRAPFLSKFSTVRWSKPLDSLKTRSLLFSFPSALPSFPPHRAPRCTHLTTRPPNPRLSLALSHHGLLALIYPSRVGQR